MVDTLTHEQRSERMRRIRSRDTRPEIIVRKMLREIGFPGYRLNKKALPGTPDIVYASRRKIIFVHGCFWHGHDCRLGDRIPKSNQDYWMQKIRRNKERDRETLALLSADGWAIHIVWECETHNRQALQRSLSSFLKNG